MLFFTIFQTAKLAVRVERTETTEFGNGNTRLPLTRKITGDQLNDDDGAEVSFIPLHTKLRCVILYTHEIR
jgi:hypothetical protein